MTDLIFHIGFPKCASTTLQHVVFPQTRGYLGAGRQILKEYNFARDFKTLSPAGLSLAGGSMAKARKWSNQILGLKAEEYSDVERLIISSEGFVNHNLFGQKPIIPFLKEFKDNIWKENGDIKIIVVLRNQADRISSHYAQQSIIHPKASQEGYKVFADRCLTKRYDKFDYSSWIKSLFENFGKENVCVLLMEDIKKIEFWNKLKTFADMKEFDPNSMIDIEKTEKVFNKRRASKGTWQLRDYEISTHAKRTVHNYVSVVWPSSVLPSLNAKVEKTCANLLEKIFVSKYGKVIYDSDRSIELTDEIRGKIVDSFYESNVQLGELIDRDLSKLGYL